MKFQSHFDEKWKRLIDEILYDKYIKTTQTKLYFQNTNIVIWRPKILN